MAATVGIAASGGGSGNSSHNNPPVDPVDPVGPVDPVDPVTPVDPVKPDASITVYDNGVTLDRGAKTLTFASLVVNGVTYTNATFTMTKQGDGYLLTAPDGKTLTVTSLNVEGKVLVMQGTYGSNNLFWSYNRAGELTLAGPDTTVIDGDGQQKTVDGGSSADGAGGTGTIINGDGNKIINDGDNSGTNGGTGTKVDGNDNAIDNGGKNTADGADSKGTDVDGNGNAINNGGENSGTNGGTGTDVTGDTNTIDNKGNNSGTDGGTGTKVDGNGNTIDNKGTNTADGAGSKGTDVDGNGNTINNGGENSGANGGTGTDVTGDTNDINNNGNNSGTDGGTGTKVDGNGNTIDNKGTNTADGAGSKGTDVDGNGNTINNGGENSGANGGTGTDVTGDTNDINNNGNNSGTDGGTGTKVDGNGNTIDNKGTNTADGAGSKGTDVDGNGNTINNGGENSGANGGTGTDVTGDTNDINNNGNNSGTDGGTGTKVDGNGNTIDNKGTNTADGAGSKGTDVDGNGNTINNGGENSGANGGTGTDVTGDTNDINNNGNNSGTDGGTGTKVDGNGNTIDNKGTNTADGKDSSGTDVTGDNNKINNEGETSASNGGTGTKVDGNENTVDNKGKTTADGEGSTGTDVNGDNNKINNEGEASASNGGTGTKVDGNGNSIDNKGATTAEGAGSTGTDVAGNNNTINNDGASKVIDGATGTKVSGDDNTLNNAGEMTASSTDSTKPSVGVDVAGNNNTVNQNGKMVVGDYATGLNVTGKSNTINLASEEMKITGQQATGVNVSGEANTVTLTGNMVVDKDQKSPLAADNFYTPSTGINVNGSGNTVVLDGHLQVIADTEVAGYKFVSFPGSQENIQGLVVSGDNNRVDLRGGVTLTGESDQVADTAAGDSLANQRKGTSTTSLIRVDGKSSVYLSGDSRMEGEFGAGLAPLFQLSSGAYMELTDGATFTSDNVLVNDYITDTDVDTGFLVSVSSGAAFINKGEITASDSSLVYTKGAGSSAVNEKSIELNRTSAARAAGSNDLQAMFAGQGAVVTNNGRITGKILNQDSIFNCKADQSLGYPSVANNNVISQGMMLAMNAGSQAINTATGVIEVYGRGNAMMAADNAYADNFGKITTDAMWKSAADTTELRANVPSSSARDFSVGMVVGTDTGSGPRSNATATNHQGATITINNAGAGMVAYGATNQVINQGTINLEKNENYDATKPLVGMAVYKGGVAYNDGTININADNGQAFYNDGTGTIHNSGTINLNGGAMSSDDPHMGSAPADSNSAPASVQRVSGYVLGTRASGSAGTLNAGYNTLKLDSVSVDTGFTAGTAATTQTFDNVFTGANVEGVENITSESVVWNAQGQKDANGNVDVTMTKNAYTDVVSDSGVNSVAGALDAAYTNNELFSSLNLKTSADVTKAMKQISGSKAVNVSRDARRLSNRFDMLADAAPEMGNGLAFNLVAKGDKRAELGKDTQYDMMALRQKLGFGDNQSLTMEYGIARLDGKGNVSSGSNGITGGYSQFLGLEHAMPLGEEGLSWNNALRYDVHQLDSKRGINYGDVNKQALADSRQQYLELRTEGRKTFAVSEGLDVVPYAGLKLRHTLEYGYQERGAGDFNLNMNSSTETAVDSVVGMKLSYAGKDGWAATATLEGGPNLSYVSTGKKASLQGAAGQSFNVDDGQKGGSINSMAQVGVKYNAGNTSAGLDAFHWKEDSISDKGFMLNVKHNF
ncbi:outer membrane autotransporter [Citrobacter freundii]|nr:outer membrane autotransporter [Citrobacter freundii]